VLCRGTAIARLPIMSRLRTRIGSAWEAHGRRNRFWKTVPQASLALFYAAVFCLFASIGIITLMTGAAPPDLRQALTYICYWGLSATLLAFAAVRGKYLLLPFIVAANVLAAIWLNRMMAHTQSAVAVSSPLHLRFVVLGQTGILTVSAGYAFFMFFFSREGTRYFRAHAEIELARELHQALVPTIQRKIGEFEIYGASIPSGEVGGDLVDLIERGDGEWTAYVADVSGHGVSPGVLMAMFKATVRTRMLAGCDGAKLLEGVHETLYPLKTSNMFVTAGFIQAKGNRLMLSLAGHPALLHYRRQGSAVCEYASADIPLGILPLQTFTTREIGCQPGDILLLLTDGITEAADQNGAELGSDPVKSGLCQWADLPLPELFRKIRELALRHGKQEDDQTMLLVRRV
jgi:hypothetical protein